MSNKSVGRILRIGHFCVRQNIMPYVHECVVKVAQGILAAERTEFPSFCAQCLAASPISPRALLAQVDVPLDCLVCVDQAVEDLNGRFVCHLFKIPVTFSMSAMQSIIASRHPRRFSCSSESAMIPISESVSSIMSDRSLTRLFHPASVVLRTAVSACRKASTEEIAEQGDGGESLETAEF